MSRLLSESGITFDTVKRAGLYSESSPAELKRLLGRSPEFTGAALVFPTRA